MRAQPGKVYYLLIKTKLDKITIIVDYNKIQSLGKVSDIIELEPIKKKI